MNGDVQPAQPRPAPPFWLVITALVAAELTCAFESNMLYVALARLYEIYGSPIHVSWLITAFTLTAAASAAVSSRLGDIFGRRRVMTIMLGIAFSGSLLSATAADLNIIILGRALQGASMAILPLAIGILRETASKEQVNLGLGILGGPYVVGIGVGTVVGGLIVDTVHWQHIFSASAAAALFGIVMVLLIIPRGKGNPTRGRLDLIGGVLLVAPIAAILFSISNIRARFVAHEVSWVLLMIGMVGLVVWVRHELRQQEPLIDVRLLANRQIATVNILNFFSSLGPVLYALAIMPLLQQPTWTQIGLGISATVSGMVKLPTHLTSAGATIGAGWLSSRVPLRTIVIGAALMMTLGWVLIMVQHESVWFIMAAAALLIAPGCTIIFSCSPGLMVEVTPANRTSEVVGLGQVVRTVAMSVGSQAIALTLSSSSISNASGVRFPDAAAYMMTFIFLAACGLACLTVALCLPRKGIPYGDTLDESA